jgi:hypothetical protein
VVDSEYLDKTAAEAIQFSGKLLSSADPSVRQLAVAAVITLTRAVAPVSTSSEVTSASISSVLARSALDSLFVSSFDQFLSKKTCRIPIKIFDEVFTRFSDYSCTVLLKSLVGGITSAKTLYLRSECCRILSGLIQRFKSLSKPSSALIINNFSLSLGNISQTLQQSVNSSNETDSSVVPAPSTTSDYKVKRMRPILQLAKDYIQLVISNSLNNLATSGKTDENIAERSRSYSLSDEARVDASVVSALKLMISSGSALHDGKSSVLKRQTEQVVELLDKLPAHFIVSPSAKVASAVSQTSKSSKKISKLSAANVPPEQSNSNKKRKLKSDDVIAESSSQNIKKRK